MSQQRITTGWEMCEWDRLEELQQHYRGGSHFFISISAPFPPPIHIPRKLLCDFDWINSLVCQESLSAFDGWSCRCCASSPFGLIPVNKRIKHKSIPLKGVKVTVQLREFLAKVTLEQTYVNSSFDPIDATLTLPMVGVSTMRRYSFEINGEVVAQGHGAYLMQPARKSSVHFEGTSHTCKVPMEQDTEIANVFQCDIGRLPPGKEANISISYTTKLSVDDPKSMRILVPKGFAPRIVRECEHFVENGKRQRIHTHTQEGNWLGLPFTQLSFPETNPVLKIRMTASHSTGISSVKSSSHQLTAAVLSETGTKADAEYVGLFLSKSFELNLQLLATPDVRAESDGCREITISEWIECWNVICSQSNTKLSDCEDFPSQAPEKIASLGSLALKSAILFNREMIDENLLTSTDSSICAVSSCRKIFGRDGERRICAIVDCISHNSCGCIIDSCPRCTMLTCSWHANSHKQWCKIHSPSMCGAKLFHSYHNQEVKDVSLQGWCGQLVGENDKGKCYHCQRICCPSCRNSCACGSFWCKFCVDKTLGDDPLNKFLVVDISWCCDQTRSIIFQDRVYQMDISFDIGTFARHIHSPGFEILEGLQSIENVSYESVCSMVCSVNRNQVGNDLSQTTVHSQEVFKILDPAGCLALRTVLDCECGSVKDYKRTISVGELTTLIGIEALERISTFMDNDFNRIVLRRCCAEGLCINFHLDHSLKTMQIALNDDTEYVGGRLVFATNDGALYVPRRPAGSVTIHNNTVVHGVSTLRTGVRYGLFLLKTLPES